MKSRQVVEFKVRQYNRLIARAVDDLNSGKMTNHAMRWLSRDLSEWKVQRGLLLWVLET